ncbi:MAG: hypothetical protein LBR57_04790 [Alistipes sp.]|jgi:hypothetical protein|nr:hypothetical protein [Alistipes sp.]
MGRFRQFMSSWKAGDFFRQLATVVIGIVITFGGSGLIQRGIDRKEERQLLGMIREELSKNVGYFELKNTQIKEEYASFRALWPYLSTETSRDIPIDTLNKHLDAFLAVHFSSISINAFDSFKNSPAINSLKNKELRNKILNVYVAVDGANRFLGLFDESKLQGVYKLFEIPENARAMNAMDMLDILDYTATKKEGAQMRRYMVLMANTLHDNRLGAVNQIIAQIQQVIEEIDKEIPLERIEQVTQEIDEEKP